MSGPPGPGAREDAWLWGWNEKGAGSERRLLAWNAVGTCRPERSRCAGCRQNLKDVLGRSRPEREVPALAPQGANAEAGDIAYVYSGDA